MMTVTTSATIAANLTMLEETISVLHGHEASLALAAVEGDTEARNEIVRLLDDLNRLSVERDVLRIAHVAALEREASVSQEADTVVRARHMKDAHGHAADLLEMAKTVDDIQARLLPLLTAMAATERNIWKSLHAAGQSPSTAIRGRNDLCGHAMGQLTLAAQNKALFSSDKRSVAEICESAWSDLIPAIQAEETA